MISSIIAILGGLVAASSFIIAKKPNAKKLIDKIIPFQGWLGVILAFWGAWGIIQAILHLTSFSLAWIIGLSLCLLEFFVGFILGYGLISKYLLERNEKAKQKGQELRLKLLKCQIPAGLILLVLGVVYLIQVLRLL